MGVDLNCAQLLIRAKKNGASFERMATLGRQGLHANRPALISILRNAGYELSRECERKLLDPTTIYSEDFFGLLGASKITAIDANSYEGAEIVHDMNRPIPECLVSSFDLLLDGGTLEHVFDFPTAIRNVMQMVATNGRFISCTVANNFSGHGFYLFSPELFYRVLCRESGYLVETCIIWEEIHGSRFYQVPDPDTVGSRIELTSQSGTYLFLQAKRLGNVSLDHIAQQSDYMRHWKASLEIPHQESHGPNRWRSELRKISILRSAVFFVRGLRKTNTFRPYYAEAEYRRRRLDRNSRGVLTPLESLRVRF
jgi:hypothetical protein